MANVININQLNGQKTGADNKTIKGMLTPVKPVQCDRQTVQKLLFNFSTQFVLSWTDVYVVVVFRTHVCFAVETHGLSAHSPAVV